MSTRANIFCKNCGNTFHIYWHKFDKQLPIECPFCDCKFDEHFTSMLKNALGTVWELNKELRSKSMDGRHDYFEVNFEEIHVPVEKFKSSQEE